VGAHGAQNRLNPDGSIVTDDCGYNANYIYQMDFTTGFPVWSGTYGGPFTSVESRIHPTNGQFCGFAIGSRSSWMPNCDLDFTNLFNDGDVDASPGNPLNLNSMYSFCQNVTSDAPVSPVWTHTISSNGVGSATQLRNVWAGNDVLIQGVLRQNTLGLQWPYVGK